MTEAEIQKQIIDYLKASGCTVIRVNSGRVKARNGYVHLAPDGTPDLLAITRRGRHVWIEVKTPKGKLRDAQRAWIDRHRARGCEVVVARALEDVQGIAA